MCSPWKSSKFFFDFNIFMNQKQMSLTQDLKWSLEQRSALQVQFITTSNWFVTLYCKLLLPMSSSSKHSRWRSSLLFTLCIYGLYIGFVHFADLNHFPSFFYVCHFEIPYTDLHSKRMYITLYLWFFFHFCTSYKENKCHKKMSTFIWKLELFPLLSVFIKYLKDPRDMNAAFILF